jgi:NADPH:quinone reductase-like Zn-dependent oxidoreductase
MKDGAEFVLNSNEEGFDEKLKDLCTAHDARIAFDAVSGVLTGRVLSAMPNNSTIYVYGALENKPCAIDPAQFIFRNKTVKGFWLSE